LPKPSSGVRAPDPGVEAELFLRVGIPYKLTERRSEGSLGSRDCTADGRIEYSIEGDLGCGRNSAERVRGWDVCRGIVGNVGLKSWNKEEVY
jgi:hypothetical protein